MANLQERRNKDGVLTSYSIRVYKGRDHLGKQLKPYTTTFEVNPNWSETTALKKAQAFATIFEKQCKEGIEVDSRLTFREYCEYVLQLKAERGIKHSTLQRYKELTKRIYDFIGHIKIKEIRPQKLNEFYSYLLTSNLNLKTGGNLSSKTVLEHHRLISTVLSQALKEGVVPYNAASRADPPKLKQHDVNYFQPEDIQKISEALHNEPIKYQVLVHLFIVTGARRGEIVGLKWDAIDFKNKLIHIWNNVLYSSEIGVYETTTKTEKSNRSISVPESTMALLKKYKKWQDGQIKYFEGYYEDKGYVFAQDNGNVMHPDSITDYMKKFSKKYNLPHINPHAFRHTMATILLNKGVDGISVSNRLGHSQVSTTTNIYGHVIANADRKNAEILEVFLN